MVDFMAVLECDMFTYHVKANISEMGVNVYEILFGDEPLTHDQFVHFVTVYGEADLDDEIIDQYEREQAEIRLDCLIENFRKGSF